MRAPTPLLGALLILLAGASPAAAQAPAEPAVPAPPTTPPPALHGDLPLSLQDAIAMAVENNLGVEIARYTPLIASQEAAGAWGAYDPETFGEFGYDLTATPNTNPLFEDNPGVVGNALETTEVRTVDGAAGVRGLVPKVGASYELRYTGQSTEFTSNFFPLDPEYRASLVATGSLPLLRNLLWNAPWVTVRTTQILDESAAEDFRRTLMDTVGEIEVSYWDLVASADRMRVDQKSVETAKALLDQTQAQYQVGVVSRVEVVEAEAGVAQRAFDLITAENTYQRSQDNLIDRVLGPYLRATSDLQIHPTDAPDPLTYDVDPAHAAEVAMERRPELEIARQEIERREVELKFAENQRLPQLDVIGSYGYAGLAGDPRDPLLRVPREFSATDDDFFSASGARSWSARAQLSIPIGNTQARANVGIAELELRRARTLLRRVEQDVILEVRDAIRNLRSAQDGIEAAEANRKATEEQLRAETIRLEHGESTPFNVLERQSDLVEAENQRILALQVYRNSLASLDRARGTILESRRIRIDDARALR